MNLQQDVDLQTRNTLRLNCMAEYYCEAADVDEVREAIRFAAAQGLRITVLGECSNVVLPERLGGLVLKAGMDTVEVLEQTDDAVLLRVGAAYNWHRLVQYCCLQKNWYGLENLALIPGSVGAAPIQNIGAYGVELADFLEAVEVIDLDSGQQSTLNAAACEFGYRSSRFKSRDRDRLLILAVILRLDTTGTRVNTDYRGLAYLFEQLPPEDWSKIFGGDREVDSELRDDPGELLQKCTPQMVFQIVCSTRQRKLPDPENYPNVGSFFTNPIVSRKTYQRLCERNGSLLHWELPDGRIKLGAGWILEKMGYRGRELLKNGTGATCLSISELHSLVLINGGGRVGASASTGDVLRCAAAIQAEVKARFGVWLEIEPRTFESDCDA